MLYANDINGNKTEAFPKAKDYFCPCCDARVKAKCGSIVSWHWSHESKIECDTFAEPMTQWHIDWQRQFSKDNQEITFTDATTGERHRADVYLPKSNTVLEFQHSSISATEVEARENFYGSFGTLIWVFDTRTWKSFRRPSLNKCKYLVFDSGKDYLFLTSLDDKSDNAFVRINKQHFITNPVQSVTEAYKLRSTKQQWKTINGKTRPDFSSTQPAVNREGFSRVTFVGYEDFESNNGVSFTRLEFTLLDKTKVNPIWASVVGKYVDEGVLSDVIEGMGYEGDWELEDVLAFLDTNEGIKYLCKVYRNDKGYWSFHPWSLQPFNTSAVSVSVA